MMKEKTPRQLERYFKGVSHHRRIAILRLIAQNDGITVYEIAENLSGNFKTISTHTQKLVQAGLVNKSQKGLLVAHSLSPYGKEFVAFMKKF